MTTIKCFAASLLVSLTCGCMTANAGPLRDLLRQHADTMEEDDSTSANLPSNIQRLENLAYGPDAKQNMDVYVPAHAKEAPIIVMVHGGAWRFGDKQSQTVVENKVARWLPKGFIVVSVNYRLLPEVDPLRQAVDVAQALVMIQSKAASWGGDASKLIVMGHSAGAHLVSLLAASATKTAALGVKPWLGTVVLDSAAFNLEEVMAAPHYRFYDRAFGKDPDYWQSASPLRQLSAGASPMLVVCSTARPDHPCLQAHKFAERAQSLGDRVEVLEQAQSHKQINQNLGKSGGYTQAVEAFMGALDVTVQQRLAAPSPSPH